MRNKTLLSQEGIYHLQKFTGPLHLATAVSYRVVVVVVVVVVF